MHTPSFSSLHTSFNFPNIRSSFRRNSSSASRDSYTSQSSNSSTSYSYTSIAPLDTSASHLDGIASFGMSPVMHSSSQTNIMSRQPSMLDLEAERRVFGSGLEILEPRPNVWWGGVEERLERL